MKNGFQCLVCLGLPALLVACGSDTPSFVEKPEGIVTLAVDRGAVDEDAFDMEELLSDAAGDDGMDAAEPEADLGVDVVAGGTNGGPGKGLGKGRNAKNTTGSTGYVAPQSADASPAGGTPDSASDDGSTPDSGVDARAVAKACQPHFQGLARKIKVVDATTISNLSVAPDTLVAFKVTGNQSSLTIHLPAGNDLPGICFFVSGNQSVVKFSSASLVGGFAYIAAGNQSSGAVEFLGGSPERSHVELKGHAASLSALGLESGLCQNAILKGNGTRFQCNR